MKKILFLLIIAMMISPVVNAQNEVFLEEQEVQIEDSRQYGWVIPLVNGLDGALKDLDNFCKDRNDIKMKKGGDNMIIAEKVSLLSVVAKRGDLIGYAYHTNTENNNVMALVFRMGYDISLNNAEWESEMNSFRNYARQFMSYHYEQAYARKLDDLNKEMKDLEKDKGQIDKQIVNMNKKIERNNNKIEKETDESVITGFRNEITTIEADIEVLSSSLPPLTTKLEKCQSLKDSLSTEAYSLLSTIESL